MSQILRPDLDFHWDQDHIFFVLAARPYMRPEVLDYGLSNIGKVATSDMFVIVSKFMLILSSFSLYFPYIFL